MLSTSPDSITFYLTHTCIRVTIIPNNSKKYADIFVCVKYTMKVVGTTVQEQISAVHATQLWLATMYPTKHLVHYPVSWLHSRQYVPQDTQDIPK